MKIKLLFCLMAAGCGHAMAQSSLTIYGALDSSVRSTRNGSTGHVTSLASGGSTTSRFGVRGTEDLGGGIAAGFVIESTVLGDTGSVGATVPVGTFFDRRSTLSLSSKSWGELRLGRDYVPVFWAFNSMDPFNTVGLVSGTNMVSQLASIAINRAFGPSANAATVARASNMVQYFLPSTASGIYGNLSYATAERGSTANGFARVAGYRLGYAANRFDGSLAQLWTGNTPVDHFRDSVASASYAFAGFTVGLAWREFKYLDARQRNLMVSLMVPVGAGQIKLTAQRVNQSGRAADQSSIDANDATQVGAGYVYFLSKRTGVYAHVGRIRNQGKAIFTLPGGNPTTAANFGGGTSSGMEIGIRHVF
jgi:predicted porin